MKDFKIVEATEEQRAFLSDIYAATTAHHETLPFHHGIILVAAFLGNMIGAYTEEEVDDDELLGFLVEQIKLSRDMARQEGKPFGGLQ